MSNNQEIPKNDNKFATTYYTRARLIYWGIGGFLMALAAGKHGLFLLNILYFNKNYPLLLILTLVYIVGYHWWQVYSTVARFLIKKFVPSLMVDLGFEKKQD